MYFRINNIGCFTAVVMLILNLSVGAWSVLEILSWFGKSLPLLASIIIGLFSGAISIPVAIIGCLLKAFGIF